jgi:hypothetical protein
MPQLNETPHAECLSNVSSWFSLYAVVVHHGRYAGTHTHTLMWNAQMTLAEYAVYLCVCSHDMVCMCVCLL